MTMRHLPNPDDVTRARLRRSDLTRCQRHARSHANAAVASKRRDGARNREIVTHLPKSGTREVLDA